MSYNDRSDEVQGCNCLQHLSRNRGLKTQKEGGSDSDSSDSDASSVRSSASSKPIRHSCQKSNKPSSTSLAPPSEYVCDAVECMLRKTSRVNMPALTHYLAVRFPDIPAAWREPIILSTFTTAKKVAATYAEAMLCSDEKRTTDAKNAMPRWLHGLSAAEPNRPNGIDASSETASATSSVRELYSPMSNFVLNRQMPMPHRSEFLGRQL